MCAVIQLLVLVSFERLKRALTPSSTAPFTTLQGAPFEPLALPQSENRNQKWPPSSGKMTTADNEDYPIWHRADSKDILFSCGQLLGKHSCATSKRGEQSWDSGRGRMLETVWLKGVGTKHDKPRGGKKNTPGPSHFLIKTTGFDCRASVRNRCQ